MPQNQRAATVDPKAIEPYFWLTLLPANNDSGFRYIGKMTAAEAMATHGENDFVLATQNELDGIWQILNNPDVQDFVVLFEVEGVEMNPMGTTRNWSLTALEIPATFEDEEDYERWQVQHSIFTHQLYISVYDMPVAKRLFRVLTAEEVNPK